MPEENFAGQSIVAKYNTRTKRGPNFDVSGFNTHLQQKQTAQSAPFVEAIEDGDAGLVWQFKGQCHLQALNPRIANPSAEFVMLPGTADFSGEVAVKVAAHPSQLMAVYGVWEEVDPLRAWCVSVQPSGKVALTVSWQGFRNKTGGTEMDPNHIAQVESSSVLAPNTWATIRFGKETEPAVAGQNLWVKLDDNPKDYASVAQHNFLGPNGYIAYARTDFRFGRAPGSGTDNGQFTGLIAAPHFAVDI